MYNNSKAKVQVESRRQYSPDINTDMVLLTPRWRHRETKGHESSIITDSDEDVIPRYGPAWRNRDSLMSNRSFWGLSLAAMPLVTWSASACSAASTWASICWVFTYAGSSPVFGAGPLLSGRLLMSNDPTVDMLEERSQPEGWDDATRLTYSSSGKLVGFSHPVVWM